MGSVVEAVRVAHDSGPSATRCGKAARPGLASRGTQPLRSSVPDQRHGQKPPVHRANPTRRFAPAKLILSNVRAIGKPRNCYRLGTGLVLCDDVGQRTRAGPAQEVSVHEHRSPSRRRDPADPAPAGARPAACAGDVCRRGRRSPDYRPGAETVAGRRGLPDQRRPVRLRTGHAGAVHRLSRRRYPAPGDDGRHLCFRRPDAVDGGRARYRAARHLWFGHRCRNLRHPCRAFHQPAAAAVSAGRHRHHHHGDRHFADAGRHQLGRRRPADPDQGGRRRSRRISQSRLRPVAGARHLAVRAAVHSRPDQMGHRLHRQCLGAAWHHRRRHPREHPRRHAFRKGRRRVMGRHRDPVSLRRFRNSISCRSSPCAS